VGAGELGDREEHAIARPFEVDPRLVEQPEEARWHIAGRRHRLGRVEGPSPLEHAELVNQTSIVGAEQIPGVLHRSLEASMPRCLIPALVRAHRPR
jgi:hypothetical protein